MKSATLENRIIDQFDLRAVYHKRLYEQARKRLEDNTGSPRSEKAA